jgi:hypothetical protein
LSVNNWRFHHIGIATNQHDVLVKRLRNLGFGEDLDFEDPLQGVGGTFLSGGEMRVEILEPLDNSDTLSPWLANGNRCYQVAFEVPDLDEALTFCGVQGARVVRSPLPSAAFDGRRIAFVMPFPGFLIELIES